MNGYSEYIGRALSALDNGHMPDSDEKFAAAVREKAVKGVSRKEKNIEVKRLVEIEVPEINTRKYRLLRGISIAAAAVVIAGAGFAAGHYFRKAPEIFRPAAGSSAGYHETGSENSKDEDRYSSVSASDVISTDELPGTVLNFSDIGFRIENVAYDGTFLRLEYTPVYNDAEDPEALISFDIMPTMTNVTKGEDVVSFTGIDEDGTPHIMRLTELGMAAGSTTEAEFIYRCPATQSIERINGLCLHLEAGEHEVWNFPFYNYAPEEREITDESIWMLRVSPVGLELGVQYKLEDFRQEPTIEAETADGEIIPLKCDYYAQMNDRTAEELPSFMIWYYPEDINTPSLLDMSALIINGERLDFDSRREAERAWQEQYAGALTTAVHVGEPVTE